MTMDDDLQSKFSVRAHWYVTHRLAFLQHQQSVLKEQLLAADVPDYDLLKEFMENKGRIQELMTVVEHMQNW